MICGIHSGVCETCQHEHDPAQLHLTPNQYYYVTIARDHRRGFLMGPFHTEGDAKAHEGEAARLAERADRWAAFDAFSIASSDTVIRTVFGTDEAPCNR